MFNSTQRYRNGQADYEVEREKAARVNAPVPKPPLPPTGLKLAKPSNAPVHPPVPIEAKPPASVVHPPHSTVQGVQQGQHKPESKRLCSNLHHRFLIVPEKRFR